jgi:hypothetical protein
MSLPNVVIPPPVMSGPATPSYCILISSSMLNPQQTKRQLVLPIHQRLIFEIAVLTLHFQQEDGFSSGSVIVVSELRSTTACWRAPDIRWAVDEMDTVRVPGLGAMSITPKDPSCELGLDVGVRSLGCISESE